MKKYFIYSFFITLAFGCLDDKTNYDYSEINATKRWEDIDGSYSIFHGDSIKLNPTIVFTIDSINPDVSYEWWVDTTKVSEEKEFTFRGDAIGSFKIAVIATDNKTGVQFDKFTRITVQSVYRTGWLILSEENEKSQLSIIVMNSKTVDVNGRDRDSIVYVEARKNIVPDLGFRPTKLVEHWLLDDYGMNGAYCEVMVVQDDKTLELNGTTLLREVYTEEEFEGGVLDNFICKDAFLSGGSNYLLDQNGYIYYAINALGNISHVGRFSPVPFENGTKYSQLIATNLKNGFIMAVEEETNTLVGIVIKGWVNNTSGDMGYSNMYDAQVAPIADNSNVDMTIFKDTEHTWERIYTTWDNSDFVSVLKNRRTGEYIIHTFELYLDDYRNNPTLLVRSSKSRTIDKSIFDEFVDMRVAQFNSYSIVASGNTLYQIFQNNDDPGKNAFMTFDSKITAIAIKDLDEADINYFGEFSCVHLGVALENGDFYIIGINGRYPEQSKILYKESGFGKVVDVMFKWSSMSNIKSYPPYYPW